MLYLLVTTTFENIAEADKVTLEVCLRIGERVAHTSLRVRWITRSNFPAANKAAIAAVSATSIFSKRKPACGVSLASRASFEFRVVIIVQVVDSDDLVSTR